MELTCLNQLKFNYVGTVCLLSNILQISRFSITLKVKFLKINIFNDNEIQE